jgi:DNA-nicking Smr family endonuclease
VTPRPGAPARDPFDPLDGAPDRTLDLHGMTASEVQAKLPAMLDQVRRQRPGALVHVITGRGKNSAGAPVLRGAVRTLLRSALAAQVAAWGLDDADGGYLVRLRGRA